MAIDEAFGDRFLFYIKKAAQKMADNLQMMYGFSFLLRDVFEACGLRRALYRFEKFKQAFFRQIAGMVCPADQKQA